MIDLKEVILAGHSGVLYIMGAIPIEGDLELRKESLLTKLILGQQK